MFGISDVLAIINVCLQWYESNKKVQERVKGLVVRRIAVHLATCGRCPDLSFRRMRARLQTYLKAIRTALNSFDPKQKPSAALMDVLTMTFQCVRDVQTLLDQVKQGEKKWLFSPESYFK